MTTPPGPYTKTTPAPDPWTARAPLLLDLNAMHRRAARLEQELAEQRRLTWEAGGREAALTDGLHHAGDLLGTVGRDKPPHLLDDDRPAPSGGTHARTVAEDRGRAEAVEIMRSVVREATTPPTPAG